MRRLTFITAGLVALVGASVAVAHGIDGAKAARRVSATFSANAGTVTSRTCTTSDNKTIVVTNGTYTGAATGDADLTGNVTLRARSVVNTTDGVGVVDGALRVKTNGKDTTAAFSAVYDGGKFAGLAVGKAHTPAARIVANISATFTPGTSMSGKIGGGTDGGSAVELGPGSCKPQHDRPDHSGARGAITSLTTTSITVANLTCSLPSTKAADINAKFKTGDRVEIRCDVVNGQGTLTSISKRH